MSRGFAERRRERRARLQRRIDFLDDRIARADKEPRHDRQERSALLWVLEELDRLDQIEEAISQPANAVMVLAAVAAIVSSRTMPTDEDLERTPALKRQYEPGADGGTHP